MRRLRLSVIISFLAAAALAASAFALPPAPPKTIRRGPEFIVNKRTSGSQLLPRVGRDGHGRFVVVWAGDDADGLGIFGRRFSPNGSPMGKDFRVNTATLGDQFWPDIAVRPSGQFVVVWSSFQNGISGSSPNPVRLKARRFDSDGSPLDRSEFQVNSYTLETSGPAFLFQAPAVTSDTAGNFVVAWTDTKTLAEYSIATKRFNSSGADQTGDLLLGNINTLGYGILPDVAATASGDFVVVWGSVADYQVHGMTFDSSGTPGDEFQVSTGTTAFGLVPKIDMDKNGRFVVAWTEFLGYFNAVRARRFDSDATPLDTDFVVAPIATSGSPYGPLLFGKPALDVRPGSRFVVAWADPDGYGNYNIFSQEFDTSGDPVDPTPFQVSTATTGVFGAPDVSANGKGDFVVAWTEYDTDGDASGIVGQRLCSDVDGDHLCDFRDIVITSHMDGDTADCSNPADKSTIPTFVWKKGKFDRFRAMVSWDPGFPSTDRITSGRRLIERRRWKPTVKQWTRACANAGGNLFVRVFGADEQARRRSSSKRTFSNVVALLPNSGV